MTSSQENTQQPHSLHSGYFHNLNAKHISNINKSDHFCIFIVYAVNNFHIICILLTITSRILHNDLFPFDPRFTHAYLSSTAQALLFLVFTC